MVRQGVHWIWIAAMAGCAAAPGALCAQSAPGQDAAAPTPAPSPAPQAADPQAEAPIVPEAEFEESMPQLGDDMDAPLEPLPPPEAAPESPAASAPVPDLPAARDADEAAAQQVGATLPAIQPEDPEFEQPLTPLSQFELAPVKIEGVEDGKAKSIRYSTHVEGLARLGLEDEFEDLSALEDGDGTAANAAMLSARAREDEALAVRLMHSRGYYDGRAISTVEPDPQNRGRLRATIIATPGALYHLGSIRIDAPPTVPPGLIDRALPLKVGDPIEADRVQGAEANVSLTLPQRGYPFAQVGQRDILLDDQDHSGAYTLPVDVGPRALFGGFVTDGRAQVFDARHIGVLARFKRGELYDSREVDDLRQALVSTSLFSTVSVEPVRTGEAGPDGTEYVDLRVRQRAGRPRTIAAELGYSTGQGIRLTGSWTHRNLFPPEGALILTAVAGTQEQGASATFRRSNAGRRDRTVQFGASADHQDYDAYEAYTGTLSARISYDSTPIWQKRFTHYYGVELVGTNEDQYNFNLGKRDRGTWLILAAPLFAGYDTSDDLLNPTRGYRLKANVSPETSVRGAARPYARLMFEADGYYPIAEDLVLAGRVRAGSIFGIARNDLPPSRRYYAGGGGSVRGFGYQELGPRSPDGKPVGGRALNEFSIEARYRFGNFGIVPFIDAGQVYQGTVPTAQDIRFGLGIGGRFYTNFGPIRVDVATPIDRKSGESKIALYISIGQAF